MARTLSEMKALIKLMKKEGVLSVKDGEIEIVLASHAFSSPKRRSRIKTPDVIEEEKTLTEEELLFWSSPMNSM